MNELKVPNKVSTVDNYDLFLSDELGRGGQGAVYRTKDADLAVKLLIKDNETVENNEIYDSYEDKVERVIALPIDDDINICKPVSMLKKPMCGYVMKLLSDLIPVSNLIYSSEDDFTTFYKDTQGFKKRLEIIIELARTLARLHSKGIVYGDLSPNNVFYSKTKTYSKVWLIDADNMRLSSESSSNIFTPGYAAPEVEQKITPNTIFSDSYSFAILAFKLLFSISPIGDSSDSKESSGGWDASTISTSINAPSKTLTWIGEVLDENDDRKKFFNALITEELYKLFEQTFTQSSKKMPEKRPSMRTWYSSFIKLYNQMILCTCGHTYKATADHCPFCNRKPVIYAMANVYTKHELNSLFDDSDINNNDDAKKLDSNHLYLISKISLYHGASILSFSLNSFTISQLPEPLISIEFTNDQLIAKVSEHTNFKLHRKKRFSNEFTLEKFSKRFLEYEDSETGQKKYIEILFGDPNA